MKASQLAADRASFRFDPVFRKGQHDRVERLQSVRRFEVKFARVSPTLWSEGLNGFEEYRAIADASLAASVEIKLGVDRKGYTLRLSDIKAKIKSLIFSKDEGGISVERLQIIGRDVLHGDDELINLLDAHLRAEVELAANPGRILHATLHQQAVRSAWNTHEDLVTQTIGKKL